MHQLHMELLCSGVIETLRIKRCKYLQLHMELLCSWCISYKTIWYISYGWLHHGCIYFKHWILIRTAIRTHIKHWILIRTANTLINTAICMSNSCIYVFTMVLWSWSFIYQAICMVQMQQHGHEASYIKHEASYITEIDASMMHPSLINTAICMVLKQYAWFYGHEAS